MQGENGKWYFADPDGNRINSEEYDEIFDADDMGICVVVRDGKCNAVRDDGSLMSSEWYDVFTGFMYGYSVVGGGDRYAIMDVNGNIVFGRWFERVRITYSGKIFCAVRENGLWNFLDADGNYISRNWWFEDYYTVHDFGCVVVSGMKRNVMRNDGSIVFDDWKDEIIDTRGEYVIVVDGGRQYAYRLSDGKCITPGGYERISYFLCGCAWVYDGERYMRIDGNGKVVG